jgi:hypothetical protein
MGKVRTQGGISFDLARLALTAHAERCICLLVNDVSLASGSYIITYLFLAIKTLNPATGEQQGPPGGLCGRSITSLEAGLRPICRDGPVPGGSGACRSRLSRDASVERMGGGPLRLIFAIGQHVPVKCQG